MKLLGAIFNSGPQRQYPFIDELKTHFPKVTFLDATESLTIASNQGMKVYFEDDPHLAESGQRVVGEFVMERIFE
jgi:hypothetical protein